MLTDKMWRPLQWGDLHIELPRFGGAFSCVPSMIDSLEVEVLYPA